MIFPNTVQSYIASFLKATSISKIIYEYSSIKLTIVYFFIYLFIQLSEASIIYFSFTQDIKFKKLLILLLSFFLIISVVSYMLDIPSDCGCFGEVLEFSNDIYKVTFNLFNFMLAIIFIFV